MTAEAQPSTNTTITALFAKNGDYAAVSDSPAYELLNKATRALVDSGTLTAIGSGNRVGYPYTFNQASGSYDLIVRTSDTSADYQTWMEEIVVSSVAADVTAIKDNVVALLGRIGAFSGTGVNTILGFLRAMTSKSASKPSDMTGTYAPVDDSLEAIRDRGDTAWGSGAVLVPTAEEIAAAVLDEPVADHTTAGSLSKVLSDASTAAIATQSQVTAVKGVADKLDTTLEADGPGYRFTSGALENSPEPPTPDEIANAAWDEVL